MISHIYDTSYRMVYQASKWMALEIILTKTEHTFNPIGSIQKDTVYSNKEINPILYLIHDIYTISKYSILYLKENDISIVFTNYRNNPVILNGKVKDIRRGIFASKIDTIQNLDNIIPKHANHSANKLTRTYFIGNFHRLKLLAFIEQLVCKIEQKYTDRIVYRNINYKQYKLEDIKDIKSDINWKK